MPGQALLPADDGGRIESELRHDEEIDSGSPREDLLVVKGSPQHGLADGPMPFGVTGDADSGDAVAGQQIRPQQVERACVGSRRHSVVASDDERPPDTGGAQALARRLQRVRPVDASRDDVRARGQAAGLHPERGAHDVLDSRPRRVSDKDDCAGRQLGRECRDQRFVAGRHLHRRVARQLRDALREFVGGHDRVGRARPAPGHGRRFTTTKVSSLNQSPPCFCSTLCVASR